MKSLNRKMRCLLIFISVLVVCSEVKAADWEKILNLKGYWKFSIGDDMKWAHPKFNDNDWERIGVPSTWENEGFHGYNGYAWYRKDFEYPSGINSEVIYIDLGNIDDVDQVYINGNLIGASGSFPPDYQTAYYAYRRYPLPVKFLKPDAKNVVAVRVFDAELEGGIVRGDIGLFIRGNTLPADLNLEGEWKFITGDDKKYLETKFNDKNWKNIIVPGYWESQGFQDYDGFAWYRKSFKGPVKLKDKKLVLLMGRIDDVDEVYLNGQLVGSTGKILDDPRDIYQTDEYQQFRGYFIPDDLLKINQENVIAVRVYDGFKDGGIYDGPIGLITQEKYVRFWREQRKNRNIFEIFFK